LKDYIKLLSVIMLTLFIFACSNDDRTAEQDGSGQEEQVKTPVRPEFDFRRTRWGMSKEEVMANEPGEPIFNTENSVEYRVFIDELQTQTNYKFYNDKLIRAGYYFPKRYEDKNEYIKNYNTIKEMIIESKGSPMIDKEVQLDPSAKIDLENKGQEVCDGKLIYGAQWYYPGSNIQLVLLGEDSECHLTVVYVKNVPNEPDEETAAQ